MILQQQNFTCTKSSIIQSGGQLIENQDGSVSLYKPNNLGNLAPVSLNQQCCTNLGYIFDKETQTCTWGTGYTCDTQSSFKLVLNPNGNDGTIFLVDNNETCSLNIDFDFLIKVKCETLIGLLPERITIDPNQDQKYDILTQLNRQNAINETLTNEIDLLTSQINSINYSVMCESTPTLNQRVANTNSLITDIFSNTAFGGNQLASKTGNSTAPSSSNVVDINFCIQEPAGLDAWFNIIGATNYQNFIDGDASSFTCQDIQLLSDQNDILLNADPLADPLIIPCTTPFGAKTALIAEMNRKIQEQIAVQALIDTLNGQLKSVEETITVSKCSKPIDLFESISMVLSLELVNPDNTLTTLYTDETLFPAIGSGLLYDYLTNNPNSGFYVCGGDNCTPLLLNLTGITVENDYSCSSILENVLNDLYAEAGMKVGNNAFANTISNSAFTSNWLNHTLSITDQTIINSMVGNKIKFSITIKDACGEVSLLLDNIKLEKQCDSIDKTNLFVTKNPGFNLSKIIDNKKSWVNTEEAQEREFSIYRPSGTNPIRQTKYNINDERLVLNTKEIDLDINLASAIETDVWCFINDNNCLLTGDTTCDQCSGYTNGAQYTGTTFCCGDSGIDFNALMTQSLSGASTVEEFEDYLVSELIDAKNRQTISSYPTLKALYDRYLNSSLYCDINSSKFNYLTMEQFSNLVGNYWVDIIEQVIPATTIWGGVKIYSNTIFDQQKFKYKSYSSLFCYDAFEGEKVSSPINGSEHLSENVSVKVTNINKEETPTSNARLGNRSDCDVIYIAQMNHGSEFVGTVTVIKSTTAV